MEQIGERNAHNLLTTMNQNSLNLPYKNPFTVAQNQPDLNSSVYRNLSFGNNNMYRFQSISSNLREPPLDPIINPVMRLTKSSECHETDSERNSKLQFFKDSMVVIKPLVSSKTSHLLTSQLEKPPSTLRTGKEVIFTETDSGNNHIERPIPKKPRGFSDGLDQFTIGCNAFSPSTVQTSRTIDTRVNNGFITISAMSNATETDNEIIALKARIDSLYSKLNEIQRKHDQNVQENKESMVENSNNIANVVDDSCGYLKIAEESGKFISSTTNDNLQVYQFTTNSDQSDERTMKQSINGVMCAANSEKKLELSEKFCDIWENSSQFRNAELTTSGICQKKSLNEIKEDEEIILVDCPREMSEEQLKNNDQNLINNRVDRCSSTTPTVTSKNFDLQSFHNKTAKQKDQCSNGASYKLERNDALIATKRIEKCWDATYLSPSHIKMTKEDLEGNVQPEKVTENNSRHCFPRANHPIESPTSNIGFQQPKTAFQPPVQFAPMLCFANISTAPENHPYFTHSYNPFSQSESVQFLSPNQLPKQFIPTMTAPIYPFQRHPNPIFNIQFPTVTIANAISAATIRPTTNALSHNSYITKRKLLLKNRLVF